MQFQMESFFNPYLSAGSNRVDAILTVAADGEAGASAGSSSAPCVVGLILDTSGSMQGDRIASVKTASANVIDMLPADTWFFIVGFSDRVSTIVPLTQATPDQKAAARLRVQDIHAGGGTCMSMGLELAKANFLTKPDAIHYALFLTDGKNYAEDNARVDLILNQCEGLFQCDSRGVGTDWQPDQLKKISGKLLGTAQIIKDPSSVAADFRSAIGSATSRSVGNVRLRLWTPKSAKVLMCKQMSPEIVDLTSRGTAVDAQTTDYPTGAWGAESRDYQVAVEVMPGEVGDEMLGCRPSIVYADGGQETKVAGKPVVASWTQDESLSARINSHVAHYSGQEELATAIQQGLEAREKGDTDAATRLLGRAAKLAQESGNEDTTHRLAKVVDIVDAKEGTVRLKSRVEKADEMDLDLGSTRTSKASRKAG